MPISDAGVDISIVVPALNEAENLPALLERIDATLRGRTYEVLIVDDGSRDDTSAVCRRLAATYPLELLVRSVPVGGLSGAVLLGLSRATGEYLVVMDADLQHPPERIPDLLSPLASGQADFVLGSRYVPGGSTDSQWGPLRRINSRVATWLARPFAGGARDPMSGFFALSRQTYRRAEQLDPVGYKIALELMCKCRARRVAEVPIHFALRGAGASKLTVRQQLRYLDHLGRLYDFCYPRSADWSRFVVGTAVAWLAALGLYSALVSRGIGPVWAPVIAFAAAAAVTAAFHFRTLRKRGRAQTPRVWADFALMIAAQWSICALTAGFVAYRLPHATASAVFAFTFGAAAGARLAFRAKFVGDVGGIGSEPGQLPVRLHRPVRDAV